SYVFFTDTHRISSFRGLEIIIEPMPATDNRPADRRAARIMSALRRHFRDDRLLRMRFSL
ncbi:MAG: hypothetical protein ACREP6_06630, partial [Candidatus Binataceae bacterium]